MQKQTFNHALPNGTKLDAYEIIEAIGSGGFGITYKALDTHLKHDVAIKEYMPSQLAWRAEDSTVIPKSEADTNSFEYGLEQFIEEGRTLARFKHANIVRVIRYFKANGTAYLVMEYEKGQTFKEYLSTYPRPDEVTLLNITSSILKGLKTIHDQGFLHRDIKPSNIYIRDTGEPLLIDFGSARQALTRQTQSITGIVTEGFAPFEQYTGNINQTPATDLYGLGATLYYAISGQLPNNALDRFNGVQLEKEDPLTPAVEVGATLYEQFFLELIDQLLSVYPEDRPQSVGKVVQSLNNQKLTELTELTGTKTLLNTSLEHFPTPRSKQHQKRTFRNVAIGLSLLAGLLLGFYILYPFTSDPQKVSKTDPQKNINTNSQTKPTPPINNGSMPAKSNGVTIKTELYIKPGNNIFKIDSIPTGAKIYVNNRLLGITPHQMSKPKNKVYMFVLKKEGYRDSKHAILKVKGYSYFLKPKLKSLHPSVKTYALTIDVSPKTALVTFMNTDLEYKDDMEIRKGKYKIKISAKNHKSVTREFDISYTDRNLKIALRHKHLIRSIKLQDRPADIICSNTGDSHAVVRMSNRLHFYNLKSGALLQTMPSTTFAAMSSSKSRLLVSHNKRYKLWNISSRKILHSAKINARQYDNVSLASDSKSFIGSKNGSADITIHKIGTDPTSSKTISLSEPITDAIHYSENKKYLLALNYSKKNKLFVIDLENKKIVATLHGYKNQFIKAYFTKHGNNVVSLGEGKVRLWDVTTQQPIWNSSDNHFAYSTLAISSDDRYAATSNVYNTILIWDLKTGKVVRSMAGHTEGITALAFFNNNRMLASGSHDNTLKIWDLTSL